MTSPNTIRAFVTRFGGPALFGAVAVVSGLSCDLTQADPVHEAAVSALGPEKDGIPQGPFHRAGQPCGVCHGGQGPASTTFLLAGTVFAAQAGTAPASDGTDFASVGVDQAAVGVLDANNEQILVATNCVGNFYIAPDQLQSPVYPMRVAVSKGKTAAVMVSHISREVSCAACHMRAAGPDSAGQVFLSSKNIPTDCPVSPITPPPVN